MWRCIRRMLPEAWKSHLAVEGYFNNIKGSRMVSFQHSEGDGIMCTCECVQVCKREGEAGEERGSGVKGERGETGW